MRFYLPWLLVLLLPLTASPSEGLSLRELLFWVVGLGCVALSVGLGLRDIASNIPLLSRTRIDTWAALHSFTLLAGLASYHFLMVPVDLYKYLASIAPWMLLISVRVFPALNDYESFVRIIFLYVLGGLVTALIYFYSYFKDEFGLSILVPGTMDVWSVLLIWFLISEKEVRVILTRTGVWLALITLMLILAKAGLSERRTPAAVMFIMPVLYEFFRRGRWYFAQLIKLLMGRSSKSFFRLSVAIFGLAFCMLLFAVSSNRLSVERVLFSLETRSAVNQEIWSEIALRPVCGWGFGADQPGAHVQQKFVAHVHNLYLELLFQGGLLFLIGVLLLYGRLLFPLGARRYGQDIRFERLAMQSALARAFIVGVLLFGVTSARMDRPEVLVLVALLIAGCSTRGRNPSRSEGVRI